MSGPSSKLRLSGSSEITRWRISSCSKYRMIVLFMRKPAGSQPEPDLLTSNGVYSDRSDDVSMRFIWNHHQSSVVTANCDGSSRLGVKVSLARMTDNALKLCQVITSQRRSVLKVFSPGNIKHMILAVLVNSASAIQ